MPLADQRAPRLVYIVTHPMGARLLLRGQLAFLRKHGFDVTVIASPGDELDLVGDREGVTTIGVPIPREIDLMADARALLELYRTIRRLEPDLVNAGTTKAGLLGTIAARLAGVPVCVYTLRGLRMETVRGPARYLLAAMEYAAAAFAHRIFAVSPSLARLYVEMGFAPPEKVAVLANGSSNGVDVDRFTASPERRADAVEIRRRLHLPDDAFIVGFVGRFTRDKGIEELIDAFEALYARHSDARLLLVGDFEEGDPVPASYVDRIRRHPAIVLAGFVDDVAPYYPLMDVLAFPSRREGFPNVPLEAAAAGVPAIGAKATGTIDAIADGQTGFLIETGDAEELARRLRTYYEAPNLRRAHGETAHHRVSTHFHSELVWDALYYEYVDLLREANLPLPCMRDEASYDL